MARTPTVNESFEQALALNGSAEAIEAFNSVILNDDADYSDETVRMKEQSIYEVSKIYAANNQAKELVKLVRAIRDFLDRITKAKAAKIVRTLLEDLAGIPDTVDAQIELCEECVQWAKDTRRNGLRQRIQIRLAGLFYESKDYVKASAVVSPLITELKKLDEKHQLVELYLIDSQVAHSCRNLSKAKAALTAARTHANAIYCPPLLQASIEIQAGILQAEEKDYKTAYSYFYESFEGFSGLEHPNALRALKYMLLCKIMISKPEEVASILTNKITLKYGGRDVDAMKAVADAGLRRSLHMFKDAEDEYADVLAADPIVGAHLTALYDTMLEQNLSRIIEPYSRVEIEYVSGLIDLPVDVVETKLSKMILDKKLSGVLDQGVGCLILFDNVGPDPTYAAALEVVETMSTVVDSLYSKAKRV